MVLRACVALLVHVSIALVREPLIADGARERLTAGVNARVSNESARCFECFRADCAGVTFHLTAAVNNVSVGLLNTTVNIIFDGRRKNAFV